jgi:hypothetical protein
MVFARFASAEIVCFTIPFQKCVTRPLLVERRVHPNIHPRSGFTGAFQFGDVEFFHLEHGLQRFRVPEQFGKAGGDDLPGEAELVFEPAALAFAAAGGEF